MGNRTTNLVVGAQLSVTALASLLSLWLGDARAAWSAALGGGISVAATAYFAWRVFALGGTQPLDRVVRAFYVGEVSKILLTALLFYIVIVWVDVAHLPLFLTYIATLLVYWMVLPFTLTETR